MQIGGIAVSIARKDIKNLHLYVKPPAGRVEVSAPRAIADSAIAIFVRMHLGWIRRKRAELASQPRQTKREFVSGETLYFFGRQYFLQVDYSEHGNALVLSGNTAVLKVRKSSTAKQRERYVTEWYRIRLASEVERLMPKWEMTTGLKCVDWKIKNMTTRWGSCNVAKGRIWLNLQLAKKPLRALEYVILHELCHLKEKTHGRAFKAMMDSFMPNWREVRKELNDLILDYIGETSADEQPVKRMS